MRQRRLSSLLLLGSILGAAWFPARAGASSLPLATSVRLGRPGRAFQLKVEEEEPSAGGARLVVVGRAGRTAATLEVPGAREATVEETELADGTQVAVVRVRGPRAEGTALVVAHGARPRVLWSGRSDLHGDPGERRAEVLELADWDGDGRDEVIVGTRSERTHVCGMTTLLDPRALDPRTLEWRPVHRPPPSAEARELRASLASPGPSGRPLLPGLHFVSASSRTGVVGRPVPAPVELVDGRMDTAWLEGGGSGGAGEFVTARWDPAPRALRALALFAPAGAGTSRPRALWLTAEGAPPLRVVLPEPWPAGAAAWVTLPVPLTGRCISLVVAEAGPRVDDAPVGLAEVLGYTDLDFEGGVEALVAELSMEPARSREAARWLAAVGPPAVGPLVAAWPSLPSRERRLALPILARHGGSSAEARAILAQAATSRDEALRRVALAGLARGGAEGHAALANLVTDAVVGDDAAVALLGTDPPRALGACLAALGEASGARHPSLRGCIGDAAAALGDEAAAPVEAFAAEDPTPAVRAEAALALSNGPEEARSLALALLDERLLATPEFAARWYASAALGKLPASERGTRWLRAQAAAPDPWMLRVAALEALAAADPSAAEAAARVALEAETPRVRAAAIRVLGSAQATAQRIAELALRDPWPLVRVQALGALAPIPEAAPVLRAAVRDPKSRVRVAAIRVLIEQRDAEAWPTIEARLTAPRELPAVTRAAIDYAVALCDARALPALGGVVDRALAPDAWAPAIDSAVQAVAAIGSIGGPEAEAFLEHASAPTAPPAVRAAVARARRTPPTCAR